MNGAPALVKRDNNNGSVNGEAAVEWHALPNAAEACRVLLVDSKVGLTDAEAAQRLQVHGKNALTPPEKPTLLKRIWQQVNNILVLILIAAAVVSGVLKVRYAMVTSDVRARSGRLQPAREVDACSLLRRSLGSPASH